VVVDENSKEYNTTHDVRVACFYVLGSYTNSKAMALRVPSNTIERLRRSSPRLQQQPEAADTNGGQAPRDQDAPQASDPSGHNTVELQGEVAGGPAAKVLVPPKRKPGRPKGSTKKTSVKLSNEMAMQFKQVLQPSTALDLAPPAVAQPKATVVINHHQAGIEDAPASTEQVQGKRFPPFTGFQVC
jgi:hypothetical protein